MGCQMTIAFAANDTAVPVEKTVYLQNSEYELVKNDPVQLKELKDYIADLKDCSTSELTEMNFTSDQIEAIHAYDGSSASLQSASPKVKMTLSRTSYAYSKSSDKTTISVKATARWEGTPLYKSTDRIALTIVGSTARFNKKSASVVVTHADGSKLNPTVNYTSMVGIKSKFGIVKGTGSDSLKIFKSLTATYTGVAQGKVTVYDYGAAYTHTKLGVKSEITLSLSAGASGYSLGAGIVIVEKQSLEAKVIKSVN